VFLLPSSPVGHALALSMADVQDGIQDERMIKGGFDRLADRLAVA